VWGRAAEDGGEGRARGCHHAEAGTRGRLLAKAGPGRHRAEVKVAGTDSLRTRQERVVEAEFSFT
jgi:hypothetical protein